MNIINEKTVLEFYIEELDKDKVDFLHGKDELKGNIRTCVEKLKNALSTHEKIEISKKLWKLLFEASMSHIDPDKRGYDELFAYFDEYVNFEELIFASDSFYRDHTIHCLWVYFLGEYLYKTDDFKTIFTSFQTDHEGLFELKSILDKSDMNNIFGTFINIINMVDRRSVHGAERCVIALTHDLGYPLKKIYKINRSIGKVLPYFSVNNYSEFSFSYNSIQSSFIDSFIYIMSLSYMFSSGVSEDEEDDEAFIKRVFKLKEKTESLNDITGINEDEIKKLTKDEIQKLKQLFELKPVLKVNKAAQLRFYKDFEEYQHGVMSAFLLMKTVKAFSSMKFLLSDNLHTQINDIDFKSLFAKSSILKAISDHTSEAYQMEGIQTQSDLLILVDELEEFSRISRANMNREFIREFCKTSLYMENGVLSIDFIFDNEHIDNLDPERAFRGRCERFLNLLNIKELDSNLKIKLRCIGKLKSNENTYTLEIARKYAKITINDVEQDIPTYLKSRQFYTREEYMNL